MFLFFSFLFKLFIIFSSFLQNEVSKVVWNIWLINWIYFCRLKWLKDLLSTNADYSQVTCKVHVHCLLLTFVEARQEQTHVYKIWARVVKYLMLHIALRYILPCTPKPNYSELEAQHIIQICIRWVLIKYKILYLSSLVSLKLFYRLHVCFIFIDLFIKWK